VSRENITKMRRHRSDSEISWKFSLSETVLHDCRLWNHQLHVTYWSE